MRIITGRFKGRRLAAPPGRDVRPTSDGLRETLFNILGSTVPDAVVVDVCAGTGAVGLEAVSRGASAAVFVERDPRTIAVLEANIRACDATNACTIVRGDAVAVDVGRVTAGTIVFVDPPYEAADRDALAARAALWVAPGGRLIVEHSRRRPLPEHLGALTRTRVVTAGDSALSFYTVAEPPHD